VTKCCVEIWDPGMPFAFLPSEFEILEANGTVTELAISTGIGAD